MSRTGWRGGMLALAALCGAAGVLQATAAPSPAPVPTAIPIQPIGDAISVPVRVNGIDSRFILDTGIGVNLLLRRFNDRLHGTLAGTYTGKRMSGQRITVPLTVLTTLRLGSFEARQVSAGVFDLDDPDLAAAGIDGFLSLAFLETVPFTIDFARGVVILEDSPSLQQRLAHGKAAAIRIERDGPSVGIFTRLAIGSRATAEVEVDTGSEALILDERYMATLGLTPVTPGMTARDGTDETGHHYRRYFGQFDGPVHPVELPGIGQRNLPIMFQRIIYDGLLGNAFLRRFAVTFDLPHRRLIFATP